MTSSTLSRVLLMGGGALALVAVIVISWQLGRDDGNANALPVAQASAAVASLPVAAAPAPPPMVASAPVAIVKPALPALKASPSPAVMADAPAILAEIPAARPICAGLARHDAGVCANIKQTVGAANFEQCQESARARLQSCNAGQGGLPPLSYAQP